MQFSSDTFGKAVTKMALLLVVLGLASACSRTETTSHSAQSKNVLTLTEANFQAEVLSASQPVLVDFWAEWCGPCKVIAPVVAELADEYQGRAKVGKVDVDAQTKLAEQYKISAIPALLIFKDGKPVDQVIGVQSKDNLKALLDKAIAAAPTGVVPAN